MKVQNLIDEHGFKLLSKVDTDRDITGLQCCDLLSWVMANGKADNAWITVQTHNNIIAVASLLDFACVIVPEGIDVPANVLEKATEEDVLLLGTEMGSYDIFKCLYEAGLK